MEADSTNISKALELQKAILLSRGLGKLMSYKVEDGEITIDIEELFECEILKEAGDTSGSNYFRGALAAIFEGLFGRNVSGEEDLPTNRYYLVKQGGGKYKSSFLYRYSSRRHHNL